MVKIYLKSEKFLIPPPHCNLCIVHCVHCLQCVQLCACSTERMQGSPSAELADRQKHCAANPDLDAQSFKLEKNIGTGKMSQAIIPFHLGSAPLTILTSLAFSLEN